VIGTEGTCGYRAEAKTFAVAGPATDPREPLNGSPHLSDKIMGDAAARYAIVTWVGDVTPPDADAVPSPSNSSN
jgi:hypothetical protein